MLLLLPPEAPAPFPPPPPPAHHDQVFFQPRPECLPSSDHPSLLRMDVKRLTGLWDTSLLPATPTFSLPSVQKFSYWELAWPWRSVTLPVRALPWEVHLGSGRSVMLSVCNGRRRAVGGSTELHSFIFTLSRLLGPPRTVAFAHSSLGRQGCPAPERGQVLQSPHLGFHPPVLPPRLGHILVLCVTSLTPSGHPRGDH